MFLYLKLISCRQYMVGSCFSIRSNNLYHLTGVFRSLIFNVTIVIIWIKSQFSSFQSLFVTPWTAARQVSLSSPNSELTQTPVHWLSDAIQPSHPLSPPSPPPSIFPSIRVFTNESALCIRWPKYWSFIFSSISSHCSLRNAFLFLLTIIWNSAFGWVYLSFSPLPFPLNLSFFLYFSFPTQSGTVRHFNILLWSWLKIPIFSFLCLLWFLFFVASFVKCSLQNLIQPYGRLWAFLIGQW